MEVIYDKYTWESKVKILTQEQMNIGGLEMFAHDSIKKNRTSLNDHVHSSMEIVYVVSGSQRYCMNGVNHTIMGNQVFITPAYTVHGTGNVVHGRCEIYWFRLEIPTENSFLMLNSHAGAILQQRLLALPSSIISPTNDLKDIIGRSFELISSDDIINRTQGCALLVQFLCEILNSQTSAGNLSKHISAAVDYIRSHIDERISLEQLAAVSMLSVSRFKYRFSQEVRITPREYVNIQKIEKAKALLVNTENSVTEIAYSLSFSSSAYFSDTFKRLVGCSPSDYRNNNISTADSVND